MVKDTPTPEQELIVSHDEADALIRRIIGASDVLSHDDEAVGDFLLLLHSITYCDPGDREYYLFAAQRMTMAATHAFEEAVHKLRRAAADHLRGVKRVEVELKPGRRAKR